MVLLFIKALRCPLLFFPSQTFKSRMDESDKIIQEDRELFPNCNYSISSSKSCRTKEGAMVCEMMKTINRNCPKERPVTIYSSKTQYDADSSLESNNDSPFPEFGGSLDLFKEIERSLNAQRRDGNGHGGTNKPNEKDPSTWIEFRFGGNTPLNEGGSDGLLGSIFRQFGIGDSSKGDKKKPPSNGSGPPQLPPGTNVGPPEDI